MKRDWKTYCNKLGETYWISCDDYVGPAKLKNVFGVGNDPPYWWRTFDLPFRTYVTNLGNVSFVLLHINDFAGELLEQL